MDLYTQTDQYNMADLTFLHRIEGVFENSSSLTVLTADLVEATHFPDGAIKPGTLLAQYASGGNAGLWSPYVHDHAGGLGLDTATAIVLDGFQVRKNAAGNPVAPRTSGSAMIAGWPLQVLVANIPGLLAADGTTPRVVVDGDLPTGFIPVSLGS